MKRNFGRALLLEAVDGTDGIIRTQSRHGRPFNVFIVEEEHCLIVGSDENAAVLRLRLDGNLLCAPVTARTLSLQAADGAPTGCMLQFESASECSSLLTAVRNVITRKSPHDNNHAAVNGFVPGENNKSAAILSAFDERTEQASAVQYFQFYGYLAQQQNMMQDYVRTSTYQRAMHANMEDFHDKVVLDVGAGSGILSFFALQSGARKVYAIEASSMALQCKELVRSNHMDQRIEVIAGKIEEITVPEKVDIIISEPMGYMLVNERMLESFIHARKFLKPNGAMFPTRGDLHFALFTDEMLFIEQNSKAAFWCQENFHGVNLACLRPQALVELFRQPIVDTWHVGTLISLSRKWSIDFLQDPEHALHRIEIPFEFEVTRAAFIHGIAFWFDVAFIGSRETVWLSTAPTEPLTHWYQVRCLLPKPLMAYQGQLASGRVLMVANERQSYDIHITVTVNQDSSSNELDLKNPFFRYTGLAQQPPPGSNNQSPSDALTQQNFEMDASCLIPNASGMSGGIAGNNTVPVGVRVPTISNLMDLVSMTNHHHQQYVTNGNGPMNSMVDGMVKSPGTASGSVPSPYNFPPSTSDHNASARH